MKAGEAAVSSDQHETQSKAPLSSRGRSAFRQVLVASTEGLVVDIGTAAKVQRLIIVLRVAAWR
jgi:hypothetical protein